MHALIVVGSLLAPGLVAGAARAEPVYIVTLDTAAGGRGELAPPRSPDPAPPTTLQIGAVTGGTVDRIALAIDEAPDGVHVAWTLELSTASRAARELVIPVAVSRDVAITGLRLSLAGASPLVGEALGTAHARASYASLVELARDPALLEWVSSTTAGDQLRLRVFPVAADAPATATIELWLPGGNQVVVDPGPRRVAVLAIEDPRRSAIWRSVATRRTWSLPTTSPTLPEEPADARAVSRTSSLVAGPDGVMSGGELGIASSARRLGARFHAHVPLAPVVVADAPSRD